MVSIDCQHRFLREQELSWPSSCAHLPLVIEPKYCASVDTFTQFVRENRENLLHCLTYYGALLFRGTGYSEPSHCYEFIDALQLNCRDYPYFTDNYRSPILKGIVQASSVSPSLPVPPHTEQAFNCYRPGIVGFMCLQKPGEGGETPLHDCVAAFRDLPESTKVQLMGTHFCKETINMTRRGMQSNFNTTERDAIEEICRYFGVNFAWKNDKLSIRTSGPCLVRHADTKEISLSLFWNVHALHFFFREYHALPGAHYFLGWLCKFLPSRIFEFLAQNCYSYFRNDYRYSFLREGKTFRLSTDIEMEICQAIWRNTTVFSWQTGDIMLIDNIKVAHSRLPYIPPRKIAAFVCNYYNARNLEFQSVQ